MFSSELPILEFSQEKMSASFDSTILLSTPGMGKFNSDDHYFYYHGQESLRRNEVAIIVNKRVKNAILGCNLKNDRMISVYKANHSISLGSKSMPQPLMPKKLKLNSYMMTYKTF